MGEMIAAVYEKGALRPLTPLTLREHQRVHIQVITEEASGTEEEREPVINILLAAGLVLPQSHAPAPPEPLSWKERRALADRLGSAPGKTASEMVMEDRGEW